MFMIQRTCVRTSVRIGLGVHSLSAYVKFEKNILKDNKADRTHVAKPSYTFYAKPLGLPYFPV